VIIGEHGEWIGDDGPYRDHHFDAPLADAILGIIPKGQSILDIGCGNGAYVAYFNLHNRYANGVDGNPAIDGVRGCKVMDAALPMNYFLHDWVVSLEVGEHIPAEFEDMFIANLHDHNKFGIILSWAIPGQGGTGHVNERFNDYIIGKVWPLGYRYDQTTSQVLRDTASAQWFKRTLMCFKRSVGSNSSP